MTEGQRCNMLADYLDGERDVDLAARYHCHRGYPSKLAAREGIRRRRTRSTNTKSITSRVTREQLDRLRERASREKTSISEQAARAIARGLADA